MVMNYNRGNVQMTDLLATRLQEMIDETQEQLERNSAKTPQWLIDCGDFFDGEVDGCEDTATPCLKFKTGSCRVVTHDSSGELHGDHIEMQNCIVCMRYGSWGPLLQENMNLGKKSEKMIVKRITSIDNATVIIQTLTYSNCRITGYEQKESLIAFAFSYTAYEDIANVYEQGTNKLLGKSGTAFDAQTLKSTSIS